MFYLYYLFIKYLCIIFQTVKSPSSRGLGHCPFTAATGVRIPLGTQKPLRQNMITSSQLLTKTLILLVMIYILHEASCILFHSTLMSCS